jgi:hypothetical protein
MSRRHQHDPQMIPLDTTAADMLFWFAENSKEIPGYKTIQVKRVQKTRN